MHVQRRHVCCDLLDREVNRRRRRGVQVIVPAGPDNADHLEGLRLTKFSHNASTNGIVTLKQRTRQHIIEDYSWWRAFFVRRRKVAPGQASHPDRPEESRTDYVGDAPHSLTLGHTNHGRTAPAA